MNPQPESVSAPQPEEIVIDPGLYNDAFVRLGTLGIRNVADMGCGAGPFVRVMTEKRQNPQVYWGLDLDKRKIDAARKRYPGWKFTHGDFFNERIRSEFHKHDAFLFLNVLEYLEDDLGLLNSLPPERHVVLSAPTIETPGAIRWYDKAEELRSRYTRVLNVRFKGKYRSPDGQTWHMVIAQRPAS